MGLFNSVGQMLDDRPGSPIEDWLRQNGIFAEQTPGYGGGSLFQSAPPSRGLFASRPSADVPAASPPELVGNWYTDTPMPVSVEDRSPAAPPPSYNRGATAGMDQFLLRPDGPTAYGQNTTLQDARFGPSDTDSIRSAARSAANSARPTATSRAETVTGRAAQFRPTAARIRANEAAANRRGARTSRPVENAADAPNAAKPVPLAEQPLSGQANLPPAPYRSQVDPAKNAQLQAAFDDGASLGDLLKTAFRLGIQFDNGNTAPLRRAIAWRDKGGRGARIVPEAEKGPRPPLPGTEIKALTTPDHPFGRTIPERIGNIAYHLGDALGSSYASRMQREAQTVSEWLPFIGGAASLEEAGTDFKQGRYGSAAANATLGAFDFIPAVGPAGRVVGRTGKHVIDSAALRSVVAGADGALDTGKAAEYLRNTADEALSQGGRVTLHVEGRAIPITKPGLVDDTDQPWSANPFLSPREGDNPRLEIDYPEGGKHSTGAETARPTIRSADQRRLSRALERQEFDNVDFGRLSKAKFERINTIRNRLGQPILQDGRLVIPAKVVRKLYEERVLKDGMTPDKVADLVFSVFHADKSQPAASRHPHIQALINAREGLSRIGFIAENPKTGETVVKSAYPKDTDRLPKVVGSETGGARDIPPSAARPKPGNPQTTISDGRPPDPR